jgi:energy-coupling factor transport system permease protein
MQEFELSRNIPIGQYIPTGSLVHRLDPRTKLLATFFLFVAVSFTRSLLSTLVILGLLLLVTRLARLPFGYIFRSVVASLPILALFLLLALLYLGWQEPVGRVYFEWSFVRLTRGALQVTMLSILRLLSMLLLISLPSLTTTITELTHGVELLLLPWRRVGAPAHEIALVVTIALRFVPVLAEELERVMKAQASRCGAIGEVSIRRPIQMARTLLPLIVPLFVNGFRRAEELALAMEARGYVTGKPRTRLITLHSTWLDWLLVTLVFALCVAVLVAPWPPVHRFFPGL